MFSNHLLHIWRGLQKNKTYTILNITGLTAGLICFSFIALWVMDESSYDKFNSKFDRIMRLTALTKTGSGMEASAVSSAPMAKALKDDYPEVENTVRVDLHEEIVTHNGHQILQPGILVADPSLFDVFSYHLDRGDVKTALSKPYSIILTQSTANKYFGEMDPMGQTLNLNMFDSGSHGAVYTITGVMPDPPRNAHFTFNMIASFKTAETANPDILTVDGWGDASFYTYLLLKKGVDYNSFSNKISFFYGKYIGDRFNVWKNIYSYRLQPLKDIHLRSNLQYELSAVGNARNVYIFSTIGIIILLLAGINYMNLATAHSVKKAKEAGIKKVVGAHRSQLMIQYLAEAVLLAGVSLVFALLACSALGPAFSQITGKSISIFESPALIVFLAGVTIFLGLVSGIYPAFIISGFKPMTVLKESFKSGSKGVMLRRVLVVSQFAVTILLITGIIVIYAQLSYIRKKDLGYNKDALMFLRVHGNTDVIHGFGAFKNDLLSNPVFAGATVSNSMLGGLGSGGSETVDANGNKLEVNTSRLRVDENYLPVYGIRLLAGRNFDQLMLKDSIQPIILNEAAIQRFGWKDPLSAIGKPFKMGDQQGTVVGVVKDFHFSPLQNIIGPLAIYPIGERFSRITLKVDVSKAAMIAGLLEANWKKHFPSALLDYNYVDRAVGEMYQSEDRFAKLFLYFSVLSLVIACLGLYGLIAYTTSQKTKEIGVRKVLGASVERIAVMLSKDFLKLIAISFLIAVPAAGYIMNRWLLDFAYRTPLSWWMFGIAGGVVLFIALLTVGGKAIRAAVANPVKSLRNE